jgi:predicted nucleic acid-binding protein
MTASMPNASVFAETVNMVGKKQGHAKAYEVGRFLRNTAPFVVIDSSPAAREKTLGRLLSLSQSVSYTDAIVMAVADEYQTKEIFGFDAGPSHIRSKRAASGKIRGSLR